MYYICIKTLCIIGEVTEILFEAKFRKTDGFTYEKNEQFINGLPNYYLDIQENVSLAGSKVVRPRLLEDGVKSEIGFTQLTPGSVVVVK